MPRAFSTSANVRVPQPTSHMSKLRRLQGANVMRFRKVLLLLAFLLASLVTAAPATVFAQTETGRITGTITDPSGSVAPGVTVTATSRSTGAARSTVTDA